VGSKKEYLMTRTALNKLKNTKFGRKRLSKLASWAIWDKNDVGDLKYIEKNVGKLNGKIVFVGLNFGKEVELWEDWQNFHGNLRLINLLSGTRYEGAYMTDIIKDYYQPDPKKVMEQVKKDEKMRNANIDFFFDEIDLLKSRNIEMYLFGKDVETIFRDYVRYHKGFDLFQKKVIKCQRIHHYSRQVNYFENIAPVQLDIMPQKKTTINVKIYDPLW
jgi:hypothetical protein